MAARVVTKSTWVQQHQHQHHSLLSTQTRHLPVCCITHRKNHSRYSDSQHRIPYDNTPIRHVQQNHQWTRYVWFGIAASLLSLLAYLLALLLPFIQRQLYSQLVIEDTDEAFQWLLHWLGQQDYGRTTTHVTVLSNDGPGSSGSGSGSTGLLGLMFGFGTNSDHRSSVGSDSDGTDEDTFHLVPAPGIHLLQFKGHWIVFEYVRREHERGHLRERVRVWVAGQRRAMLEDLVMTAQTAYRRHTHRHTAVYTPDTDCYAWTMAAQRPRREASSVVLRAGQMDALLSDGRQFLSAAPWYQSRGIPYRRGYLLHGPPGTGKTSAVLALAGALGLDVCAVSLASKEMTDDRLSALLRKAPARSLLLLEDVDCALSAESRLSLSAVLNALDGVAAQEGRLVVMTTNHPDRLNPAMVRPGRVDRTVHVGLADKDQVQRYFCHFYGHLDQHSAELTRLADGMATATREHPVTTAMLQGHLLRFRDNPTEAVQRVSEMWTEEQEDYQLKEREVM